MKYGNPELRRNLWLEFTATRLVGMPLVLGAIFFLAWLMDDHQFGVSVRGTAIALFVAVSVLWGSRQATESIFGELRERTWDWQRLSAIGPWSLAWGKLVGSTLYTWYGGAMALFFYLLADSALDGKDTIVNLLILVVTALLAQTISMLASLQAVIRERTITGSHATAVLILALFVIYPLGMIGMSKGDATWYGTPYPLNSFMLCSLSVFSFWALAGAYRQVRCEFRMRAMPVAWIGFLLFLMIYGAGFVENTPGTGKVTVWLAVALGIAGGSTYLMLFLERKDQVALRHLLDLLLQKNWRLLLENAPCWLLCLPFVFSLTLLLLIMPGNPAKDRIMVVVCLFFLLRDLGLILYLNLSRRTKRADLFALLCLGILYGLLPGILQAMETVAGTALFWPRIEHWQISLVASFLEAALIWRLLTERWKLQG